MNSFKESYFLYNRFIFLGYWLENFNSSLVPINDYLPLKLLNLILKAVVFFGMFPLVSPYLPIKNAFLVQLTQILQSLGVNP